MPRKAVVSKSPRMLTSEERAERNRERAEDGALAMAEYQAAAAATIARIPKLRKLRLAKAARQAKIAGQAKAAGQSKAERGHASA